MATASKSKTGFNVACPKCGEHESLTLALDNVQALECSSCGESFSAREARDLAAAELARWEAVCRWVDLAAEMATTK
jgi:uncharacterized protein (DUF983 family)